MKLDNILFDEIQKQVEVSPRLRMHYDLRTQADLARVIGMARGTNEPWCDSSQRMINVLMLEAGGPCSAVYVTMGIYHTCVCLEPGSVIFEAKDRAYAVEATEDFL